MATKIVNFEVERGDSFVRHRLCYRQWSYCMEFKQEQAVLEGRIVRTTDDKRVGLLLANGKVLTTVIRAYSENGFC